MMEKLLNDIDVDWLALEDVGNFVRGKRFVKADIVSDGVPCIHYGEMYTHYGIWAKESRSFLASDLASKLRVASYGDVIIVAAGETIEDIGNGSAWLGECDVVVHDACFSYRSKLDPKYVSYFLRTNYFKEQIKKSISSGKISSINSGGLGKAKIPIPYPKNPKKSMEIQAEIVRVLDIFEELIAELTIEKNNRKKQYDYYRNQLLNSEKIDVELRKLGDIAEYSKTRISFDRLDETNYVGVDNLLQNRAGKTNSNYVPTSGNLIEYREGDILIGNIRPYLKKIWQADQPGGTNGDVLVIRRTDETINARYLYQVLADENFFEYDMQHAKGAKMPRGNKDKIMEFRFQVPKNPDEQARIAFILDKFEALTNSIGDGLPREIELRQKQYEHYRNLMFSFPGLEQEAA